MVIIVYPLQCNLEVTPEAIRAIAGLAMERKTGARGLRAIMVSVNIYTNLLIYTRNSDGPFHAKSLFTEN